MDNDWGMILGIPRTPFLLTLAGAIPFLWGALTVLMPGVNAWGIATIGPRFVGPYVQLFYGAIILAFMSGVLWGFAAKHDYSIGYGLSVIPALWAFFMTGGGPTTAAMNLCMGFLAVLLLDWHFWRLEITPAWWFKLRVIITAIVIASFIPLIF